MSTFNSSENITLLQPIQAKLMFTPKPSACINSMIELIKILHPIHHEILRKHPDSNDLTNSLQDYSENIQQKEIIPYIKPMLTAILTDCIYFSEDYQFSPEQKEQLHHAKLLLDSEISLNDGEIDVQHFINHSTEKINNYLRKMSLQFGEHPTHEQEQYLQEIQEQLDTISQLEDYEVIALLTDILEKIRKA